MTDTLQVPEQRSVGHYDIFLPNTVITTLHDALYQLSVAGNRQLPCYLGEMHRRGLPHSLTGPLWIFYGDDKYALFRYARFFGCRRLAVRHCPSHLRPSGLLCRSPSLGGRPASRSGEMRMGRRSQHERWIAKVTLWRMLAKAHVRGL